MRLPRFRLRTIMIAVALAAIGMALARRSLELGAVYALLVLGIPVIAAPGEGGGPWRLRSDVRRSGLCYLAGVVGPMICLILDPFVFRGGIAPWGKHTLASYRISSYGFMGIEMLLMTFWLVARPAFAPACALIAGAFWAAAVFATGIGLVLIPISAVGLLFLIGALGFTPFLTALAFSRQGRLALAAARPLPFNVRLALQLAGASLAVAPAAVAQVVLG
jgi:hypothetical protein